MQSPLVHTDRDEKQIICSTCTNVIHKLTIIAVSALTDVLPDSAHRGRMG